MSPNIDEMRNAIIQRYPKSDSWRKRVMKMPEGQVIAIYLKGQSEPKPKPKQEPDTPF